METVNKIKYLNKLQLFINYGYQPSKYLCIDDNINEIKRELMFAQKNYDDKLAKNILSIMKLSFVELMKIPGMHNITVITLLAFVIYKSTRYFFKLKKETILKINLKFDTLSKSNIYFDIDINNMDGVNVIYSKIKEFIENNYIKEPMIDPQILNIESQ
ncbi:putative ORFan [Cotonvirus japonicus]|uniref:ORFan n=1 Tax=Cotonvirus japonicus TaxID=2811091 RepID=A0ABM7NTK5_9VIRU|nr:putative ORFan [Cotonvirus japonicus]BCS83503.1 putative ORFan [Cotonvirus japonicus]